VLTGLYTIVGGLLAVVWTESLQTVVLLLGAISLTTIAYHHAGGWNGLTAVVDPVKLTVLRSAAEAPTLPWYAVLLGYPVIGLWYWRADQTIVQRVLGARDENHARLGPLFAGFLKILPVFIFVLPGLLCEALIRQGRLPSGLTDSADTYAFMVTHLLPVGLKGLVAAALLAALMSTVSGALNSIATLFCWDLYRRFWPATPERQLVTLGRWVTALAMIAGILWTPFIRRYQSIFQGINTVICYIAPPITTVFLFGGFGPALPAWPPSGRCTSARRLGSWCSCWTGSKIIPGGTSRSCWRRSTCSSYAQRSWSCCLGSGLINTRPRVGGWFGTIRSNPCASKVGRDGGTTGAGL